MGTGRWGAWGPRGSTISWLSIPPSPGRNEPLKKERPKWKSDYPMTDGQLRSKRDEFWDTAPAFEGRKEIWDALKAAAYAVEANDHSLAQAILDGASITLPHGEGMAPRVWVGWVLSAPRPSTSGCWVGEERGSQLPSTQLSPAKGGKMGWPHPHLGGPWGCSPTASHPAIPRVSDGVLRRAGQPVPAACLLPGTSCQLDPGAE